MIGKDQQPLIDQYSQTILNYIENQKNLITLKNETISKFNDVTLVHYQRNKEKIVKIKEEFQHTQEYQNKLTGYVDKLNEIGNTVEGMESSVDYIDVILKRIENKLEDLEQIKP